MILRLDPGVNRYYVQTLCMVFFPGAKFAVDEEITPETPIVTVNVFERKETVTARVTITVGEISDEEKNKISHRSRALADLLRKLES